jgi:hypothetical protein
MLANDNATLNQNTKEQTLGAILSPQLRLGHRSEALDLNLTARIDLNGYAVNSQLSSVDDHFDLHSAYKASELSTLSLDAGFHQDTILNNPEDNPGQLVNNVRVTTLSATPSWSYQLSELDRLDMSAGYLNKTYGGGSNSGLTDYSFYDASAGWFHRLTEIDALSTSLSYSRYEPQGAFTSSGSAHIFDAQLGWKHDFSEVLHLQVSGGPSLTLTEENGPGSGTSTNFVFNGSLGLTYRLGEQTDLQANLGRKSEPTSNGQVQVRDRIGLTLTYRWNELTTLRFLGSYVGSEGSSGSSSTDNLGQYFSIEPSVTWQLRNDLELGLSYRLQEETFRNPSGDAMSNAVFLTLTYRAPRWSWSD